MLISQKHIMTSLDGIYHYIERLRAALNYHHQSLNEEQIQDIKYYISTMQAGYQALEQLLNEISKTNQNG